MNYPLILEALLTIGELAARIAETRGYDNGALDAYNTVRSKLRRELMRDVLDSAQEGSTVEAGPVDDGSYEPMRRAIEEEQE